MRLLILCAFFLVGCETAKNSMSLTAATFPLEGQPLDRLDMVNMIDPENRRRQLNDYCQRDGNKDTDDFRGTDLQCAVAAFETYFMTNIEFEYYQKTFGTKSGKSAQDKSAQDKSAQDKSAQDKSTQDKSTQDKSTQEFEIDPSSGLPVGIMDKFQQRKAKSYALALRRNEIQDAVMRHSDEYCRRFQEDISDTRSLFQMVTGGLSTTLGGLGAIFTDAGVARALAGAAGITSGLNAEFESAFFQQQALSTIFAGMNLRRMRVGQAISARRFRSIDGSVEPKTKVVASLMKDGKIHDASIILTVADIVQFAKQPNYLYVVNFQETPDAPAVKDKLKPEDGKNSECKGRNAFCEPSGSSAVALVSVASYTLERAIGDSIIYHQACSLTEGLIEAEYSITTYEQKIRTRGTDDGANVIEQVTTQRRALGNMATGAPVK